MNCEKFQQNWPDYLDDALPPSEKEAWEAHSQACSACRQAVEALDRIQQELRGIPPANPLPPVFWKNQAESILKKVEAAPARRWARFWSALLQPPRVFAAAAMAVMIFFGYQYVQHRIHMSGSGSEWAFQEEEGTEDSSEMDLSEEQLGRYYAYLANKYLPNEVEEDDSGWGEELNEAELDQAIHVFEQKSERKVL